MTRTSTRRKSILIINFKDGGACCVLLWVRQRRRSLRVCYLRPWIVFSRRYFAASFDDPLPCDWRSRTNRWFFKVFPMMSSPSLTQRYLAAWRASLSKSPLDKHAIAFRTGSDASSEDFAEEPSMLSCQHYLLPQASRFSQKQCTTCYVMLFQRIGICGCVCTESDWWIILYYLTWRMPSWGASNTIEITTVTTCEHVSFAKSLMADGRSFLR